MVTSKYQRDVDQGWAWYVLLASYFNLLVCSGLAYVAGLFQLVFLEHFQGSVSLTSWITALFSSFMQLGGPLSSAVCNCFNCRTAVMLGGAFMCVGLFVSAMANSLEVLFVTFGLLAGSGVGLAYTASIIILNIFFVERRTLVTGIALSAAGLGIIIWPQVSRILFDNFTWRETLIIMAGASAQVCVTGALMASIHEAREEPGLLRRCCSYLPWCESFQSKYGYGRGRCNDDGDNDDDSGGDDRDNDAENDTTLETRPETSTHGSQARERGARNDGLDGNTDRECETKPECSQDCSSSIRDSFVTQDQACFSETLRNRAAGESLELIPEKESVPPHLPADKLDDDVEKKRKESSTRPFVLSSHKILANEETRPTHIGSHQEIASGSLSWNRKLKREDKSSSHQELCARVVPPIYQTLSNTNLARIRSNSSPRAGTLSASKTSLDPSHDLDQAVVISRNASLLGLSPCMAPVDIIITSRQELQSNPSLHSNSILENKVVVSASSLVEKSTESGNIIKVKVEDADGSETEIQTSVRKYPSLCFNKCFWVLCLSLFVGNAGCGIFNIHFPSFLKKNGLSDQELTNLLSINGFAILFGRCFCGALANAVRGNDLLIWWALHVLGGVCVCLMPSVGHSYTALVLLVYGMGNYYGTVYAVLSSITIEMVGLAGLATSLGAELVFAGLGYFVAPSIAGMVVDHTNSYDHSMYLAGSLYILGGMITGLIPLLSPKHLRATLDDVIGRNEADHDLDLDESDSCFHENQDVEEDVI